MRPVARLLLLSSLTLLAPGCRSPQSGLAAAPPAVDSAVDAAGGSGDPLLPDPKLTPGATLPVTPQDICVPGYSRKVRNVPAGVKRQVYAEYGITRHKPGDYEVDHLISLQLGGSNSVRNLWPQSFRTRPWNARVKDALENRMHADVCRGRVGLASAQHDIAADWIAAYKKYFHTDRPLSQGGGGRRSQPSASEADPDDTQGEEAAPGSPAAGGQVWVNLKSGKYFRPGSPYYGHTKRGQFLPEAAAKRQGYVAAQGQ